MTWVLVALLGVLAGLVSGLFGVGGAIVIVPGLVLLAQLPQHTAHGTSLAALAIPVGFIVGTLEYHRRGQVNLAFAVVIALGLVIGAYFGSRLAGSMSDVLLRKVFGGFLLLVSVRLLVF
ncbi:MAG: TSUP family transporter [Gemmatimonadales bacterium]